MVKIFTFENINSFHIIEILSPIYVIRSNMYYVINRLVMQNFNKKIDFKYWTNMK